MKEWLTNENPLGLFRNSELFLTDIDPKPWSGHFNYLATIGEKQFVLRFKGPEWGTQKGIIDEYNTLEAINEYAVGPQVYYLSNDFFGEPMMLQEYLPGTILSEFSAADQKEWFPKVADLIAKINAIPITRLPVKFQKISYIPDVDAWHERMEVILRDPVGQDFGLQIQKLLPKAEHMVTGFEKRLRHIIHEVGPVYIFESSHIGHCLVTNGGVRFINWEPVSSGDPSYTLAVFLASIYTRPDFEEVKEIMIRRYLTQREVPEFAELVEQRLKERQISDFTWLVWMRVTRGNASALYEDPNIAGRLVRVKQLLGCG